MCVNFKLLIRTLVFFSEREPEPDISKVFFLPTALQALFVYTHVRGLALVAILVLPFALQQLAVHGHLLTLGQVILQQFTALAPNLAAEPVGCFAFAVANVAGLLDERRPAGYPLPYLFLLVRVQRQVSGLGETSEARHSVLGAQEFKVVCHDCRAAMRPGN